MASHSNQHPQTLLPEPTGTSSKVRSSQLLEVLSNEKLKFALTLAVALISSYVTSAGGQSLRPLPITTTATTITPNSVVQLEMFAFALLGLFTSSLSAITFHPNFPLIADCFENISVIFVAVAFASLVSIILHDRYGWMPYMACMIPVLPFIIVPCKLLFAKLEAMLVWLRRSDCFEGLPMWNKWTGYCESAC